MYSKKRNLFLRRRSRIRKKLYDVNKDKLRLSVHRTSKNISVQLIDDTQGRTMASASSYEKTLGILNKNNMESAKKSAPHSHRELKK